MSILLGGKTLFTFESRKKLLKFRWQWSLVLALILGAGTISQVSLLETFLFTASLFVGFFLVSFLALTKKVVTIAEETETNATE